MNLPNKLTIARIVLTFVFMLFLFSKGLVFRYLAYFTFLIAALTDLWDGKLARKKNQITNFGKLMDPIADKILVLAAFLGFVELGLIPAWMVVLIVTREFVITGLRIFALSKGEVISASEGAKHKTASQMSAIFLILAFLAVKDTLVKYTHLWSERYDDYFNVGVFCVMLLAVILTLISGFAYLMKNRGMLLGEKNR